MVFGFRVRFQNPKSGFPNPTFPSPHRSRILRFLQGSVYKIAEILRKYIEGMTKDANYIYVAISYFFYICLYMYIFVVVWSKKASIGMFVWTRSKITLTKEEGMRKGKSKEEETRRKEKAVIALVVFIMATLQIVLGLKKLLGPKGPFGGNVFERHTGQAAFLQSLSCTLVGRIEHIQSRGQKLR